MLMTNLLIYKVFIIYHHAKHLDITIIINPNSFLLLSFAKTFNICALLS